MAFRTVVIKNRCKLEFLMNYMVCRKQDGELKILLDEVRTIVIDSLQVVISSYLIFEIAKRNIKLIFIDNKHNPIGEIIPYQGNAYSYRHIKEQISFDENYKGYLWKRITIEKIRNQARVLKKYGLDDSSKQLIVYSENVNINDETNREGHSAKVYFNSLFGTNFSRDTENDTNKFLNYGYSIILSTINREIVIHGYLPEIGIHHIGESNPFNLACDFMEPLRPLVDNLVYSGEIDNSNYIDKLIGINLKHVKYCKREMVLENAIHLYVEDLFNYLNNGDEKKIGFIEYGL